MSPTADDIEAMLGLERHPMCGSVVPASWS